MGGKLKLNDTVQADIVRALNVGATHELACQYAGIDHATFYRWLNTGETGKAPYAAFYDAVKQAEGQAAIGWLALIDAAARDGHWQAAAWKLERRYPKIYGRRPADDEQPQLPDIHVHIDTARERLTARLGHLSHRHREDGDVDA
jgi:hypothetical protein